MARSVWKELMKLEVRQPLCARAYGAACGKFTCDAPDGVGRDLGDARRPFGRVLC